MEGKAVPEIEKDINSMTREEILNVPGRGWQEDIGEFDSLIIIPLDELHESDYRLMDFVACIGQKPVRRLSGCSDVIHIGGVGGHGKWSLSRGLPSLVRPVGWSIDCLKESGLLRLFSHQKLTCGTALSSFDIYVVEENKTN